jgi:hypothetical protein
MACPKSLDFHTLSSTLSRTLSNFSPPRQSGSWDKLCTTVGSGVGLNRIERREPSQLGGIDRFSPWVDTSFMSAALKQWFAAILFGLSFKPLSTIAASVPNFPPNPVGEKLYRAQFYHELFPVVIIALLLMAYLIFKIVSKIRKPHFPR